MIAQSIVPVGGAWAGYARDSAEIYRALQRVHDIGARAPGSLYVASTELERRVLDEFARMYGANYNCAYLDADEARYRYPFIQASYCVGALLFPDDLTLEPRRMLRQLIPYLTQQGLLDYAPHTSVVAVEASGQGCLVRDARGHSYAADRVIVCGGADCTTLFPTLLERSGLRLCKLQMMRTVPRPGYRLPHALLSGLSIRRYPAFASCPSYASLLDEPVDTALRDYGVHLLFKQLPDGSIVVGDSHEYVDVRDAALLAESTNPAIDAAILGYGRHPGLRPAHARGVLVGHPREVERLLPHASRARGLRRNDRRRHPPRDGHRRQGHDDRTGLRAGAYRRHFAVRGLCRPATVPSDACTLAYSSPRQAVRPSFRP